MSVSVSTSSKRDNRFVRIIAGPIITFLGLVAIWENEGRFNYYKAAHQAPPLASLEIDSPSETASYSGDLKPVFFGGKYIESYKGYLKVSVLAEIYSWRRDRDSDGGDEWKKGWHPHLQSNSRNQGLQKILQSHRITPNQYQVEELTVVSAEIHFVDGYQNLALSSLSLSQEGRQLGLQRQSGAFYLLKQPGESNQLGNERIRIRGIPAAEKITYFGKIRQSEGRAKQFDIRQSFVSKWIQNDGILHHLVNGSRTEALDSMKAHYVRIKWIVRGVGTAAAILGIMMFLSLILHFLIAIPFLGRLVNFGVFTISVLTGLTLALATAAISIVVHNFLAVVGLLLLMTALIVILVTWRRKSRHQAREYLSQYIEQKEQEHDSVSASDAIPDAESQIDQSPSQETDHRTLAQHESVFRNLCKVAAGDDSMHPEENRFLAEWARSRGIADERIHELFREAREDREPGMDPTRPEDLPFLASLAMADGYLSSTELKQLHEFGKHHGLTPANVIRTIQDVQQGRLKVTATASS